MNKNYTNNCVGKLTIVFLLYFMVSKTVKCKDPKKYKFRLKKYNDIWTRALSKNLPLHQLEKLKPTLVKLDKMELDVKHWDQEEQQEFEEMKPKIQGHLMEVLKQFGLLDHDLIDQEDVRFDDSRFDDSRLNQIWETAVDNGHYTKEELHSLLKEMRHMEKKIDELRVLKESGPDKTLPSKKLEKKEVLINGKLKTLQESVFQKKKENFNDNRVADLWSSAQKASFSTEELETVREELEDFQKYVDKYEHWVEMHSSLQEKGSAGDALHALDKMVDYKRKVRKYHKTMETKIRERIEL